MRHFFGLPSFTRLIRWAGCVYLLLGLLAPPAAWAVPGDINGPGNEPDGFVGLSDIDNVLENWNQTCDIGDWTHGDIDGDGYAGIGDLDIILDHWNHSDQNNRDAFIGTNVSPVAYWRSPWAFVDVMKMGMPWVPTNPNGQPFDTGGEVDIDEDGWPELQAGEAAHTLFFRDINGRYPTGQYVCTYDGTGTITFDYNAINVTQVSPGRVTFEVQQPTDDGILMRIVSSDQDMDAGLRECNIAVPSFVSDPPAPVQGAEVYGLAEDKQFG